MSLAIRSWEDLPDRYQAQWCHIMGDSRLGTERDDALRWLAGPHTSQGPRPGSPADMARRELARQGPQ